MFRWLKRLFRKEEREQLNFKQKEYEIVTISAQLELGLREMMCADVDDYVQRELAYCIAGQIVPIMECRSFDSFPDSPMEKTIQARVYVCKKKGEAIHG